MGEVILFIPRPNPNRDQLIEQARSNYDSVFPTLVPQALEIFAQLGAPPLLTDKIDEPKESV